MKEKVLASNPRFCRWMRSLPEPPAYFIFQAVPYSQRFAAERYYTDLLRQIPSIDLLNVQSGATKPRELQVAVNASISVAKKGWNPSRETRARMSAAQKARFARNPKLVLTEEADVPILDAVARMFGNATPSLRVLQQTFRIGQERAQRIQKRLQAA